MNVLLKINKREKNRIEDLKTYENYLIERFIKGPVLQYPEFNPIHSNSYTLDTILSSYLKILNKEDIQSYQIDIIKHILGIE